MSHTGSKLTYEVTTSMEDSLPSEFSIDPHNGTLFLIARLDYEQAPQHYVLVVKAIAQHSYPLTTSVEVLGWFGVSMGVQMGGLTILIGLSLIRWVFS